MIVRPQFGNVVPAGFYAHQVLSRPSLRGLGAGPLSLPPAPDAGSLAQMAANGAATTGAILQGLSAMGALAPEFALAGPIGAAVAGLTSLGLAIANVFSGCGQSCVLASDAANQVGAYLQQNNDTYFAAPVHYRSLQQGALNNIKTAMNSLQTYCSQPQLGSAGQRCISERLVRNSPAPWCPNPGHLGCDYWVTFWDPIANDPHVVDDPPEAQALSQNSGGAPQGSASMAPLLIVAGLMLVGVALL